MDFFISYNKADRQWAEWIAWQLDQEKYSIVLQAWNFRPGSNFVLEMQKAASEAERTIAVFSPEYLDALYTQPEWAAAFAQDPTGNKGILLPVRVHTCELKGLLANLIYIDLVGQEESSARELLLEGIKRDSRKPRVAPIFPGSRESSRPITALTTSNEAIRLLPERPPFPKDLSSTTQAINIFYAYASEDEELRIELEKQLTLLKNLGLIEDWHSGKIGAGRERVREIEQHWKSAQIILLLISANFMASDAYETARQAMQRHTAGTARVVPVILRPVDWRGAPFDGLEVLPTNGVPITSPKWSNRDEAFLDVAKGIRDIVDEMTY